MTDLPPDKQDRQLTRSTLFDGAVTCWQYRQGYRFSLDAVLLAHFLQPVRGAKILDIGTGSGIIPLILNYRWGEHILSIDGLELQPELQALARQNFRENRLGEHSRALTGDIRKALSFLQPEQYHHITCNPPFYPPGSGRQNNNSQARLARHQVAGGIDDFAAGCAALLRNRGTAVFIFPAEKSVELFAALTGANLEAKRIQFIYSYPTEQQDARLLLVECSKNGGTGARIMPPFYIYLQKNGEYSEAMQNCYRPHSQKN